MRRDGRIEREKYSNPMLSWQLLDLKCFIANLSRFSLATNLANDDNFRDKSECKAF